MADKTMNVDNAEVTITLSVDGKVYLVAMPEDNLKAIAFLIKQATETIVPTGVMQGDLRDFLMKGVESSD